jgi:L-threonylcarbamoyladenylate synthase
MSRRFDTSDPDQRATGLREAASAVKRGDLVVLPTDTVYGLGADAFTNWAVQSLLDAKGRGRAAPTPVLVPSPSTLHGLVTAMPAVGWELVDAFWPGGLTLIAMQQPTLNWDLGDSRGTVAVRMPLHPVAIELLTATGPMAVSSANKSGMPAATTAQEAQDQLGDAVSVYLDAGPVSAAGGGASSIVDITGPEPLLLREGAIPFEKLAEVAKSLRRAE